MIDNRLFPPRIKSPTYSETYLFSYLCSGLAICAIEFWNRVAQIAKLEHRWGSKWESSWERL